MTPSGKEEPVLEVVLGVVELADESIVDEE